MKIQRKTISNLIPFQSYEMSVIVAVVHGNLYQVMCFNSVVVLGLDDKIGNFEVK